MPCGIRVLFACLNTGHLGVTFFPFLSNPPLFPYISKLSLFQSTPLSNTHFHLPILYTNQPIRTSLLGNLTTGTLLRTPSRHAFQSPSHAHKPISKSDLSHFPLSPSHHRPIAAPSRPKDHNFRLVMGISDLLRTILNTT